ncbi:MAG: hypoxanthine phosphoribosyltransferase [Clostridiales bacterium]|jgi:hypoxanthine phosphoribosyltransferase|nr:hypoxanthine phosphoribosyltransferase [Clostridiales bacterium]
MNREFERILIPREDIAARVAALAAQITRDYADAAVELVAVAILKGSVYFFADLTRQIGREVKLDFMAVTSYGSSAETSGEVKILKDLDGSIKGKDVLVIEDIVDSGVTLFNLTRMLREKKPRSIKVCAFLDKPARRKIDFAADYVGFTIPDAFVVGYGLDYAQSYRNFPDVAVLSPAVYKR